MSGVTKPWVPATITDAGGRNREPYARIEGRGEVPMPMGWSYGSTYPVGTVGRARYHSNGSMGLWKFEADDPDVERGAR